MSVVVGAAAFVASYVFIEAGLLISAALGIAGIIGGYLMFAQKKIDPRLVELARTHGITEEKLKKIIKHGKKKLREMKKLADQAETESMKQQIMRIYDITEKIYEDFKVDPKDIKAARQFLNYYLDATLSIISQYIDVSQGVDDPKKEKTRKKIEKLLANMETTFEKQLKKLYEDDYLNLDTEIDVLEKSIKLDGL